MIRAVLIDDEPDSNSILRMLLEKYCPQVVVIGTAEGVDSGAELIGRVKPDLVFMDIEMTHGNAFDLLNRLQPVGFHVIFVTAFDNHAVRAFKYNALDYLLKPVNIRELCSAVERLSGKLAETDVLVRVKSMLETIGAGDPGEKKVAIPTLSGLSFVSLRDVIRLEAKSGYTVFHLNGGASVMATRSIREYEEMLPESTFYRIHNSHIINLNKIKSYQKGRGGFVTMEDDSYIEVATRRREGFLQRLLK